MKSRRLFTVRGRERRRRDRARMMASSGRRSRRLAIGALVAIAVVVGACAASNGSQRGAGSGSDVRSAPPNGVGFTAAGCPKAIDPGARAAEGALHALRTQIRGTWKIANQDGPVRLTTRHYIVEELLTLAYDDIDVRGISSRFATAARRLCGPAVARGSWVAIVHFPDAQLIAASEGIAFLARTAHGWTLWYRYR